jgi:hypothetical protein
MQQRAGAPVRVPEPFRSESEAGVGERFRNDMPSGSGGVTAALLRGPVQSLTRQLRGALCHRLGCVDDLEEHADDVWIELGS